MKACFLLINLSRRSSRIFFLRVLTELRLNGLLIEIFDFLALSEYGFLRKWNSEVCS